MNLHLEDEDVVEEVEVDRRTDERASGEGGSTGQANQAG